MRIFVTGVGGQLGHDVMNELAKRGYEGVGSDIAPSYSGIADGTAVTTMPYVQMDITDKASVEKVIKEANVDAVIHCAAWTAVDAAEDEENQPKVRLVNVTGTQNIADVCKELDIKMLYLSTDYVFDGQGTTPWEPDCKDYKPLNVYGQTKLDGELAVSGTVDKFFIVRIAWVFGKNGKNFIKTMINLGKTHDTLSVVNDQIGTPTYTYDLARLLVDMIETGNCGQPDLKTLGIKVRPGLGREQQPVRVRPCGICQREQMPDQKLAQAVRDRDLAVRRACLRCILDDEVRFLLRIVIQNLNVWILWRNCRCWNTDQIFRDRKRLLLQIQIGNFQRQHLADAESDEQEIGRASCRERV